MALLTVALGGACGGAGPGRNDTIPWPDTSEAEWVAVSVGGSPMVPGTRVTMATSPGGIGGYTGCNWYGLRPDSQRTLVEMTARGCRSDIQDQERRLTMLLPRAAAGVRRGDTLVLLDSIASPLMVFVRRQPTGADASRLVGTSWRLATSTSPHISIDSVLLRFSTDSMAGFGGCREFEGTYAAREDRLRFTYLSMRPLDCRQDRARVAEENLTTVFSETEHFEVRADTLLLTTFGGDTLRFRTARP
jgi:heat shock protein HslJ